MPIHALAGLPRSGSTLIANVLAQHPDVHVSGTSALTSVLDNAQGALSNDPTVISELTANEGMYRRYGDALRGLIEGWYSAISEPVILDKGRAWAGLWNLARDLYPDMRMLVPVRDPRDVVASIEKQNKASAVFRSSVNPDLQEAASQVMSPQGIVGMNIKFVEDLLRRRAEGVMFLRYESFVVDPRPVLASIVEHLNLEPFDFDIDNVESRGGDADEVWRGKYPHHGVGQVTTAGGSWEDILPPELAEQIAGVYPYYMATFSYT